MNDRNYMRSYCELQLEYKTSLIELKAISELVTAHNANPESNNNEIEKLKRQYENKQQICMPFWATPTVCKPLQKIL